MGLAGDESAGAGVLQHRQVDLVQQADALAGACRSGDQHLALAGAERLHDGAARLKIDDGSGHTRSAGSAPMNRYVTSPPCSICTFAFSPSSFAS